MSDLLHEALKLPNFPLTILLGLVVLFWVLTIVGAADTDSLEPDLDVDLDADADADAHGSSFRLGLLRFFNLGEIPLMVLLSVLIALMWGTSVLLNYYLNPQGSLPLAAGLLLGNFIVCLFATKLVTTPLKPFMRALRAGEKHRPVVGRSCIIKTSEVTEDFGQAECEDESGNPLLLHVRISEGQKPLSKGDRALVVETLDNAQTYIVRKLDS